MTNATTNHAANGAARATGEGAASEVVAPLQLDGIDRERRRRYREHLDWYEGKRGAPPVRGRDRALNFNYARAVVEKGAAYLVTDHRPTVVMPDGDADARRRANAAQQALAEVWDANDLPRLDLETEVDTAVLGDGA
ncbi:MAG TPA: hypothetical protein QGI71_08710 [Dehalococcoidia bacterium]|jgi:hypothetical protein|nr:hypothetical protein [Dehalococcoidia bacterium]